MRTKDTITASTCINQSKLAQRGKEKLYCLEQDLNSALKAITPPTELLKQYN